MLLLLKHKHVQLVWRFPNLCNASSQWNKKLAPGSQTVWLNLFICGIGKRNNYQDLWSEIRPRGFKTFSCATQLCMKFQLLIKTKKLRQYDFLASELSYFVFIMLINVKMPTQLHCWHINIYEHDKLHAQLSWAWKKVLILWGQVKFLAKPIIQDIVFLIWFV